MAGIKFSFVMAGLVPAIHVFAVAMLLRRGCPRQARAWRSPLRARASAAH